MPVLLLALSDEVSITDPKLVALSNQIPLMFENCRAKNTKEKYVGYYRRFKAWCNMFVEIKEPVKAIYVTLFLISQIQAGSSDSVIESYFYAIKHHYSMLDINPCDSKICKMVLEAGKRLCSTRVRKKEPITADHIRSIYDVFGGKQCKLTDFRTIVLIVLGYCGFMRYSELSFLRASDFEFQTTHVEVFIEQSKTDIYRDGHWLHLARTGSELCPVSLAEEYFRRCNIDNESEEHIFRGFTYFKRTNTYKLRKSGKPISYSTARENVLSAVKQIGLDPKKFGLHSLRSGGATAAANNGVKDRLFKRHGRWKSDRAKDGYIKDCLNSLLSVSCSLGL